MITKDDAERLKAFISASFMGIVDVETGPGGCETCGYGAPEFYAIDGPEKLHGLVDQFVASNENK